MDEKKIGRIRSLIETHRHLFQEFSDLCRIDPDRHRRVVIERLAERGGFAAIRELIDVYGVEEFMRNVGRSRQVSDRTRNFFRLLYA